MDDVREVQARFDGAELAADRETPRELIAEDFLSIGPRGCSARWPSEASIQEGKSVMTAVARFVPDRAAMSGAASGAVFVAGIAGTLARSDVPYPRPGSDASTIRRFFHGNHGAARISATSQLVSAAMLGRFTASVVRLAGSAGPGSRALQVAAGAGGATAVASLAGSGLISATLARDDGRDDEATLALHRRAFLLGGIVHGVGFGLLVGALGLAGRRTGALPSGLTATALGSAAAGLLTPLYLAAEPAGLLIPIGRFSGLVASALAGVRLARGGR